MTTLQQTIESAWERRAELAPATACREVRDAVAAVIADLDAGQVRVAEKRGGDWVTHKWLKMAVLLSFRLAKKRADRAGRGRGNSSSPSTNFTLWPNDRAILRASH